MERIIPIASVCAKPFTVPEPFRYNTNAAIKVVILPSIIADNALEKPILIEDATVFPLASSSRIRVKMIQLASTAIPILNTIPAIPGRVSVTFNPLRIRSIAPT